MTGHSIQKLRNFAPPNSWVIVFMGLITTTVKNTVAVYRVYKTYLFCSFPFSQLLFTVWAKIKFSYYGRYGRSTVRNVPFRFYEFFRSYA